MKLSYLIEKKIYENLTLVKFKYSNYKNDPNPRVKVLDYQYPGQPHQKTYGQRQDVLGFNLNYFKNPKYAEKAIDDIDGFARMLSANKDERYRRLKAFYPEVLKFIRRYNRQHINKIKRKDNYFYKRTTFDDLIKKDNEDY